MQHHTGILTHPFRSSLMIDETLAEIPAFWWQSPRDARSCPLTSIFVPVACIQSSVRWWGNWGRGALYNAHWLFTRWHGVPGCVYLARSSSAVTLESTSPLLPTVIRSPRVHLEPRPTLSPGSPGVAFWRWYPDSRFSRGGECKWRFLLSDV